MERGSLGTRGSGSVQRGSVGWLRPAISGAVAALLAVSVALPAPAAASTGMSFVREAGAPLADVQLDDPVAVATDGTYLYVADHAASRIVKLRATDGSFVADFSDRPGSAPRAGSRSRTATCTWPTTDSTASHA